MNSTPLTLGSLRYFNRPNDFSSAYCIRDEYSNKLDLGSSYSPLRLFAAVIAHNERARTSEGWGFLIGKNHSRTFCVYQDGQSGAALHSLWVDIEPEGYRSPQHQLMTILGATEQLRDPEIKKFLREYIATCTETMWSLSMGVPDQIAGLNALSQLPHSRVVSVDSDPASQWQLTTDVFSFFRILSGNQAPVREILDHTSYTAKMENGNTIFFEQEIATVLTSLMDVRKRNFPGETIFALNHQFPRHVFTFTGTMDDLERCTASSTVGIVHFPETSEENANCFTARMHNLIKTTESSSRKVSLLLDKLDRDPRLEDQMTQMVSAVKIAGSTFIDALKELSKAENQKKNIWRVLTGSPPNNMSAAASWRKAIDRRNGEVGWVPGTAFTGPSVFSDRGILSERQPLSENAEPMSVAAILNPMSRSDDQGEQSQAQEQYFKQLGA